MKSPPGGGREGDFFVPSVGGVHCRGSSLTLALPCAGVPSLVGRGGTAAPHLPLLGPDCLGVHGLAGAMVADACAWGSSVNRQAWFVRDC